ncbi:MAG: glycosyl hydrolase family 28-related protein, partial [Armatimonadota bacterium]
DPHDKVVKQVMAYASSNYELTINVSGDLQPGDYRVYLHNTRGNELGWSEAVDVQVRTQEPWPDRRIDARTGGVVGDGLADDTAALQQVMDECARAGGGTVRLPAGTFLISDTLRIPPDVWLRGAGMDSTRIQFDTSVPFVKGKKRAVLWGTTRFRLTDLSVLSGPATVRGLVISNDDGPAEDCLIRRCRFKALVTQDTPWNQGVLFNLPWVMPKHPILNCEISDCDVEATYSIFLSSAKRCRVVRNRLAHTQMPMACWSMVECLIEGNYFVPTGLRETSPHGPMLMAKTGYFGGVVGNVFRANVGGHHRPGTVGPRNVGEAFAFDCLANVEKAVLYTRVARASADSVTFAEAEVKPDSLRDMTAFIVSGKGVGQVRVVTANDATKATVDPDWNIIPDETSMFCITRTFRGNMILRNMFADAGSCFIWGRGFHNIFALNQLDDVGFLGAVGLSWRTDDRPNPCFFNEFNENWLNYRYARGGGAGVISGNYRDAFAPPLPGPLCYGTILRANKITGGGDALKVALGGRDQLKHEGTLAWDTLFEGNELRQCKTGASICARAEGTILRANSMQDVQTPLNDEGVDTVVLK